MTASPINFSQIRLHRSSQNTGFEELTRQLVLAAPPTGTTSIDHKGPGADGGVEVLVHLSDGTTHGWQSKFFVEAFGDGQVAQIKDSFRSALSSYPTLTKYFVAIPRNLSGPGTSPKSDARLRWTRFLKSAKDEATALQRTVEIVLWDETELVRQLTQSHNPYPGILTYWFDVTALSAQWFRDRFDTARADLGDRYSPMLAESLILQLRDPLCRMAST